MTEPDEEQIKYNMNFNSEICFKERESTPQVLYLLFFKPLVFIYYVETLKQEGIIHFKQLKVKSLVHKANNISGRSRNTTVFWLLTQNPNC